MSDYIINFTDPLKGSFVIRPYTSNGPKFPTTSVLNDTSIAAGSTLLLYGKGHPDYGERTNENLLNLLENFSGATEPVIKVTGMLWHKEVLYYKDTGGGFYVAGSGSPQWTSIALFGTGALPGSPPIGLQDGDYWWDNSGSPTILYQYSADERNINNWLVREFTEASGAPTADPVREMQIYDGNSWDVLPDLSAVTALVSATLSNYLRLDTTNDPLTGDLEISKVSPALDLTGSNPIITLTGSGPVIDLVGSDPTLRLRGGTNWQVMGDDAGNLLEVRVGSTPNASTHFVIDNANGYLTHGNHITAATYATNINGIDNALANVKYVDNQVAGAIVGDTFISGGTFAIVGSSPGTGTLTMPYSTGSPGGALVISGFDSNNIPFVSGVVGFIEPATTVDDALLKAAPLNNPTFIGQVTVPALTGTNGFNEAANKGYVDAKVATVSSPSASSTDVQRSVQSGGGTSFIVPFSYPAGSNRLMVFKNGVKQYKDELAASTATFSPSLTTSQILSGLPLYLIVGVSPQPGGSPAGTNTWTISGNHASEFTAGDTFDVFGNSDPASNKTYTVASVTSGGSPVTTDIVVVGGSPAVGIPSSAFNDGIIGINYEFRLTIDGTGPLIVSPVNLASTSNTVDNLITQMQSAIDATFGVGVASVYLHSGNIRVDSLGPVSGSPPPSASMINSITSTTSDLFSAINLTIDGFNSFIDDSPVQWSYVESDGGSPVAPAAGGTLATDIEFNTTTVGTDIIEFLLV